MLHICVIVHVCGFDRRRYNPNTMAPPEQNGPETEENVGPRGGTTTATGAMRRITLWVDRDVLDHIARLAFETNRTTAEIIRERLRDSFGIE